MGNVYVTGISDTSSTVIDLTIVKYADSARNTTFIRNALEMLTVGLINESENDTIKDIVYASCDLCVDSFYHIRYDSLIARATHLGLDLKQRMNADIANYYSSPPADYVGNLLASFWVRGTLVKPFLGVAHYDSFPSTDLANHPKLAYGYQETDYPINCINCSGTSQITYTGTEANITWIALLHAPQWYYNKNSKFKYITNCIAQLSSDATQLCKVCPGNTTLDAISYGISAGTLAHHEIEIIIGEATGDNEPWFNDACYSNITGVGPFTPSVSHQYVFARLTDVHGVTYWHRTYYSGGDELKIKKLQYPITDKNYFGMGTPLDGNNLTLCEPVSYFNSTDENNLGTRYALGMGGIFKIDRPGINQQPVYFAFPYSQAFWFNQGPDMRIYYGTHDDGSNTCTNGERDIYQVYEERGCEFCASYPIYGLANQDAMRDYLATTDFNFIYNYWTDNVISLTFTSAFGNQADPDNVHIFTAGTSGSSTTPSGTLVGQMLLNSDGNYEVTKYFISNQTFSQGTTFTVRVRANFANGEYINETRTVTLDTNVNNYELISAEIRGNINNYSSSIVNYQIDIYTP